MLILSLFRLLVGSQCSRLEERVSRPPTQIYSKDGSNSPLTILWMIRASSVLLNILIETFWNNVSRLRRNGNLITQSTQAELLKNLVIRYFAKQLLLHKTVNTVKYVFVDLSLFCIFLMRKKEVYKEQGTKIQIETFLFSFVVCHPSISYFLFYK